jgi:serine/threonine protein kinase
MTDVTRKLISIIYGRGFTIFDPNVPVDSKDFHAKILQKHYSLLGPFPLSYQDIADDGRLDLLGTIMAQTPPEAISPFSWTTPAEVSEEDMTFILRIMKHDPRDRPTAQELLEDEWFQAQPELGSQATLSKALEGDSA